MRPLVVCCIVAVVAAMPATLPGPLKVLLTPGMKSCGWKLEYWPDSQSCCGRKVFDIPEKTHAQCCDGIAYWRNETKPDRCMIQGCNAMSKRHPITELCCKGKTFWVGPDGDHYHCCGTSFIDKREYQCCGYNTNDETSIPYHNSTMDCDPVTHTITLRRSQRFDSSKVCKTDFDEWDATRPIPAVANGSHYHLRGMAVPCTVEVRNPTKTRKLVRLSFTPFVTTAILPHDCAAGDTMDVVFKVTMDDSCEAKDLRNYFRGMIVDIFFRHAGHIVCRKGVPTLRVKPGYQAVVFVSKHSDAILRQSLTSSGSL